MKIIGKGVLHSHYFFTGGDKQLHGESCYRLGVAYERNGDPSTALTVS